MIPLRMKPQTSTLVLGHLVKKVQESTESTLQSAPTHASQGTTMRRPFLTHSL